MNKTIIYITLSCLFITLSCKQKEKTYTISIPDNTLLSMIFSGQYSNGGFTVIAPETEISHITPDKINKDYIIKNFAHNGYKVEQLMELLFIHNENPTLLTLESSPENGYLIDYDESYKKYFQANGGGWQQWYIDHPNANGYTSVSLPVYDPESGFVMIYKGTQTHNRSGSGWIHLYKYLDGKLEYLTGIILWKS